MRRFAGGSTRGFVALACTFALVAGVAPSAADEAKHTRLYLLAGREAGHTVWSTTPADREAAEPETTARCDVSPDNTSTFPCRTLWSTSKTTYQAIGFSAGSLIEPGMVSWGPNEVRFHLEMTIDAPAAPEVAVFVGGQTVHAATQVSPGVWEGRLSTAGSLDSSDNTAIYVGVRSAMGVIRMSIKTAGASWFEFPRPFAGMSGPEVVAADGYRPAPSVFRSAERTFRFNDGDWEVRSFTGTQNVVKTVPLSLARPASAVYAYVEGFSEPVGYTATHGSGRGLSLTEQPIVQIFEGPDHLLSIGPRGAAETEIAAGDHRVEVRPNANWSQITGPPPVAFDYTGYIVVVYGKRTLAGMHFPFPPSAVASFHTPVARNFPPLSEHVPVPEAATSLAPVLQAERTTLLRDTWAMPYDGHTSGGSAWNGQRVYVHDKDVFVFGVTAMEEHQVSAQDVKYWLDVSYTYSPGLD